MRDSKVHSLECEGPHQRESNPGPPPDDDDDLFFIAAPHASARQASAHPVHLLGQDCAFVLKTHPDALKDMLQRPCLPRPVLGPHWHRHGHRPRPNGTKRSPTQRRRWRRGVAAASESSRGPGEGHRAQASRGCRLCFACAVSASPETCACRQMLANSYGRLGLSPTT